MEFTEFVLSQLPPAPARVLEVGCGEAGGLVEPLVDAGYDVLGVDPHAPEGERFRRLRFEELDDGERYDAVVAARMLHHVNPLGEGLDRLARLAPLVLVDEFAHELIDEPTRDWYESQYRLLRAAGVEPVGPDDLGEWRWRHPDLHPSSLLLDELAARFEERHCERRPYLYRWLDGPASEALEETLIAAGAISAVGLRYAGVARTETTRSSAPSR